MAIAEILFHQITDADILKFHGESNTADTGDGAKDLRYGKVFGPALDRLFPKEVTRENGHDYRIGTFCYEDENGIMQRQEGVHYSFKRTKSRNETRLSQLDKIPFFNSLTEINSEHGLLFLALIRMTDGLPQMQFLTEQQINDPRSNQFIAEEMKRAISRTPSTTSVKFTVEMAETMILDSDLTKQAIGTLHLLAEDKNVLLTGAPATGKTTLLNLVEYLFMHRGITTVNPNGSAAFPLSVDIDDVAYAGGDCKNRKVFRTTFHQGTKYRDFVRGLIPVPSSDSVRFEVSKGLLWQAAEYAKQPDSAALLIIDEINRGPAVSIFGDMISAFEADKRLGDDGKIVPGKTVTVQILNDEAELEDYQLPSRLYILAAMNQADSSVEPMDAAFMRRWRRTKLFPSMASLCQYFGTEKYDKKHPDEPQTAQDVYAAAADALNSINYKIGLGRGDDYRIGQGVFMKCPKEELPQDVPGALRYIADCWPIVDAHIEEVFFNDKEAIAFVLNAEEGTFFKVSDFTFAGRQVIAIEQPYVTSENVYKMLLSLLG